MTTTLTPGTLVVTINEQVTLNGQEANSVNTLTLTNNIAETYKRILTVPTSEIVAWTNHDTDVAGSQFDDDLVKKDIQEIKIINNKLETEKLDLIDE